MGNSQNKMVQPGTGRQQEDRIERARDKRDSLWDEGRNWRHHSVDKTIKHI
jgi:hypothetical protein